MSRFELIAAECADHDIATLTELVEQAVDAAVFTRGGAVAGTILHSDRGSQYTSHDLATVCSDHGLRRSMGPPAYVGTTPGPNHCGRRSNTSTTSGMPSQRMRILLRDLTITFATTTMTGGIVHWE